MGLPRKTIDEIVTSRRFQKSSLDIYVEGYSDKRFIERVLGGVGFSMDYAIYIIDSVDVASHDLAVRLLPEGSNRSRVICLGLILGEKFPDQDQDIYCIYDRDFDRLNKAACYNGYTHPTKWSCMEGYLWESKSLKKFVQTCAHRAVNNIKEIEYSMSCLMIDLFAVRYVIQSKEWNVKTLDWTKYAGVNKDGVVEFDRFAYVKSLAGKANRYSEFESVKVQLKDVIDGLHKEDIRQSIHGHDFAKLLLWYAAKTNPAWRTSTEDSILEAYSMAVDESVLIEEEPFNTFIKGR